MKKSFSLLELILVLTLLGIFYTLFIPKNIDSNLETITNRLALHLKLTRYQALLENSENPNDKLWHKKRWTLKFFNCRKSVGGIYYTIYSDNNNTGHVSVEDTLKDSLSNKNIYSSNYCNENTKNSKYVLLTKNFNINSISISCNNTNTIGQLSFSENGKVYNKLSNEDGGFFDFELNEDCTITIKDRFENKKEINIEKDTGYIKINNLN